MVKVSTLTPAVKKNILSKARSGNYYVRLTNWNPKTGQHFVIFPTNVGLERGIRFNPEYVQARFPEIPRPGTKKNSFDKRGGFALKSGRFFKMSNSVSKLLQNSPRSSSKKPQSSR
jgi:hypothetical protein